MQRWLQQGRGVDICVAVDAAHSGKLSIFQSGNQAEDALLLGQGKLGLKADKIKESAGDILSGVVERQRKG